MHTSLAVSPVNSEHHTLPFQLEISYLLSSVFQLCLLCLCSDFKLATLCFKSHIMRQPDYLPVTLDQYEPSRSLRSSTQHLLSVPFCSTVLDKRRFSVAAPQF